MFIFFNAKVIHAHYATYYKQNKITYAQIFIVCLIRVEFSSLVAQMVKNLLVM